MTVVLGPPMSTAHPGGDLVDRRPGLFPEPDAQDVDRDEANPGNQLFRVRFAKRALSRELHHFAAGVDDIATRSSAYQPLRLRPRRPINNTDPTGGLSLGHTLAGALIGGLATAALGHANLAAGCGLGVATGVIGKGFGSWSKAVKSPFNK
ncbi:hypothetical protein F9C11_19230 [Amycolatopsis sp. VS8301801F10]|uniref:hypothetical protein n=1 Tax=Amycolatopsis sp. VS8301801F10 TaxID=2652442 RepID=UPI0038FC5A4C